MNCTDQLYIRLAPIWNKATGLRQKACSVIGVITKPASLWLALHSLLTERTMHLLTLPSVSCHIRVVSAEGTGAALPFFSAGTIFIMFFFSCKGAFSSVPYHQRAVYNIDQFEWLEKAHPSTIWTFYLLLVLSILDENPAGVCIRFTYSELLDTVLLTSRVSQLCAWSWA